MTSLPRVADHLAVEIAELLAERIVSVEE